MSADSGSGVGLPMRRLLETVFNPPWWAITINPHFLPRRAIHRAMRTHGPSLRGRVLDVGCGVQPYRELLTEAAEIIGLELDTAENRESSKRADYYYDGLHFPFPAASFDSILCNQVLEHVFNPDEFLLEIARVLRPGGVLVLSVPFFWPEHERPWDSQRFTSHGLAQRLRQANLSITMQQKLVPGCSALCALMADRVNSSLSRWHVAPRMLGRMLACAPLSLLGCALLIFSKDDDPLFLDNFVVARKIERKG